jgi:hypothetical protein
MNEERRITVELSEREVLAVVLFHKSQMKKIVNALGKASLDFSRARDLKALHGEAKKLIESHTARGKELLSLLK